MFKFTQFCLSEPICTCEKQNVSWLINLAENGHDKGLRLECETCKTVVQVPLELFKKRVKILFDKPYPKDAEDESHQIEDSPRRRIELDGPED